MCVCVCVCVCHDVRTCSLEDLYVVAYIATFLRLAERVNDNLMGILVLLDVVGMVLFLSMYNNNTLQSVSSYLYSHHSIASLVVCSLLSISAIIL